MGWGMVGKWLNVRWRGLVACSSNKQWVFRGRCARLARISQAMMLDSIHKLATSA